MAFWSGERLLASTNVVSDFNASNLDGNSYTLRMGDSYFRTAVEDASEPRHTEMLRPGEPFVVPPGQFAFLLTKESVAVPDNAMAFISMRTKIKFRGLINVSGFHVDPGYAGRLVFAVFNAGPMPIQLREDEKLFKIWFADLDQTSEHVFMGSPVNEISNDMVNSINRSIYSLQTLAEKIREIEGKVDQKLTEHKLEFSTRLGKQEPLVESLNLIWRTIIIGVVGFVLISLFAVAWPTLSQWATVLPKIIGPQTP